MYYFNYKAQYFGFIEGYLPLGCLVSTELNSPCAKTVCVNKATLVID